MKSSSLPTLRCPSCHAPLTVGPGPEMTGGDIVNGTLTCPRGHAFAVKDSISDFVVDIASGGPVAPLGAGDAESDERALHDIEALNLDPDLIVDEGHLFPWLNYYQIFQLLPRIQALKCQSLLSVMCGPGYEFDLWSRVCPEVWGADVSTGLLHIAHRRHQRLKLAGDIVSADVLNLPFVDGAFDIVVVHAGLHHMPALEPPLSELLRLARRYCILVEPAHGLMRRLLIRTNISPDLEPLGSRVYDIREDQLRALVEAKGASLEKVKYFFYPRARVSKPTRLFQIADALRVSRLLAIPMKIVDLSLGPWIGTKGTFVITK